MAQTLVNTREVRIQGLISSSISRLSVSYVTLSSTSASFIRQKNASTATPSTITVTATLGDALLYNAPAYKWERSTDLAPDTWTTSGLGTSSTQVITNTNFESWVGTGAQLRLRCTVSQAYRVPISTVYIVNYIKEGSDGTSGSAGLSALTLTNSRPAIVLPSSDQGIVSSYNNSGTTIQIQEGNTLLTYVSVLSGAGQFTLGTIGQSPASTIGTLGTVSGAGTTTLTIGNHNGMAQGSDSVVLSYPLTVVRANNTTSSVTASQAITKAKAGLASSGTSGASAVFAYRVVSSASLPASPTIADGTIPTSGTATSSTSGWYVTPAGSLSASEWMFQVAGTRSADGSTYSWINPSYLSSFRVGSLSALTVSTGALTVDNTLTIGTSGSILTAGGGYTSTGIFLGSSGGVYRFSVGTGTSMLSFDGSVLSLPGGSIIGNIASNTVINSSIAQNAISTDKIAANAVTSGSIAAGAVTAGSIAANAISSDKIAAGAITAGSIAANAVTAGSIAANAVTTAKIAAGAITAGSIAANAVTAGSIAANAISSDKIAANAVTAGSIAANAITSDKIAANAITANSVAAGAITTSKLTVANPGVSMHPDPTFEDQGAWAATYGGTLASFKTVTDSPSGRYVAYVPAGTVGRALQWFPGADGTKCIPINANKQYRLSFWYRVPTGSSGNINYATLQERDSTGALIGGNQGHNFYMWTAGVITAGAWTKVEVSAGAGTINTFNPATRFVSPSFLFNWETAGGELQIADIRLAERVDGSLLVDGAVSTEKLTAGAVTAGSIAAGAVTTNKIAAGAVTAGSIAANAITSDKIAAGAVTAGSIAAGAVTAGSISVTSLSALSANMGALNVNNTLTLNTNGVLRTSGTNYDGNGIFLGWDGSAYKFSIGNGTGNNLSFDGAILTVPAQRLSGAIASGVTGLPEWLNTNITINADGTLGGAGTGQINLGNLQGQVTAAQIAANAVTAGSIAANAITSSKIAAGAITAGLVAANAILSQNIAANAITAGSIAANAVTTGSIAANAITSALIAANAITAGSIAANAVTTAKIAAGAITAGSIAANAVTAGSIAANAITSDKIAANAVTAGSIAANAVSADKIAANAVTAGSVAAGAITASKLVLGDSSNMIPGADLSDSGAWNLGTNVTIVTTADANVGTLGATRAILISNVGISSQYSIANPRSNEAVNNDFFGVEPNAHYRISAKCLVKNTFNGQAYVILRFYNSDRATYTDRATSIFDGTTNAKVGDTIYDLSYVGQAPSTAVFLEIFYLVQWTSLWATRSNTGTVYFANPRVHRAMAGELVVDGAITASKIAVGAVTAGSIAANAITSDKISAGAITSGSIATGAIISDKISAGAITTQKLLVTGSGASITPDPNTQDLSAWVGAIGAGGSIVTDTTSPTGYALRLTTNNTVYSQAVPLDETKNYQARISVKQESGSSITYGTIAFEDGNSATLEGNVYPTGWPSFGSFHYFGLIAQTGPVNWTEYRISFGPNETAKIPPGTKFVRIGILANYSGTGVQRVTNLRITEKANADLIVDGSISAIKIAANAISSDKIAAGAITAGSIASNAISSDKIAAGAITAGSIAANAVTAGSIAANAVTTAKIAAGAITAGSIAANAVTAGSIAANAISSDKIAAGAITAGSIASNAISSDKIAAGAITAGSIAANAVTAGSIASNAISSDKIAAGAITAGSIAANAVTAGSIAANAVTTAKIAAGAITAGSIAANAVTAGSIASGAIRAQHILVTPKSLNPDPLFEATSSLWGGFVEQRASTDGVVPAGCPARLATKFNARDNMGFYLDVNPGEQYKVSIWVNREGATAPAGWVSYSLSATGADLLIYWAGSTTGTGWQQVVTTFTVAANCRRMRFGPWIDYPGGATQYIWATDFQIERVNDASLIVDGSITASKLTVTSLSAVSGTMGALTVDNTLSLGTNGVIKTTGINYNGNGIFLGRESGNNRFSVGDGTNNLSFDGTTLTVPAARISGTIPGTVTPPGGWLNSNVTINADGTLSNAGTGQVTPAGLNINLLTFINDANCQQYGDTIKKVSGGTGWNAGGRSREAFAGGAFASITTHSQQTAQRIMFGLNASSYTSGYEDIDFAIYLDQSGNAVRVYENSVYIGDFGTFTAGETYTVQYDGQSVKYMRDGSVFLQHGAVVAGQLFFDCSFYNQGDYINGVRFGPLTTTKNQNLLDSRTWVYGTAGNQPGFNQNPVSSGGSNQIILTTLPDGTVGQAWMAISGTATSGNAEGGWDGIPVPIDYTKAYRFSVWIRRVGTPQSGSFYLGVGANTVRNLSDGTLNDNPYFLANGRVFLPDTVWCLAVGYVWPHNWGGGQTNAGGLYNGLTGARIIASTDFRWFYTSATSFATASWLRTYQYYTTETNNRQDFFDPRIEIIDGTEPSIAQLLATGNPNARNPINSSNITSYISGAAIGDAQIGNLNAGKINAGTINADRIAASSITANKLTISGRGAALNDDPGCQDQAAWTGWSGNAVATVTSITDGKVGNSVLRVTGVGGGAYSRSINSRFIPCDSGKTYRLSAWVRRTSDCNGVFYLRTTDYLSTDTLPAAQGLERTYWASGQGAEGISLPSANTWLWYSTQFTVPSGRAFFTPQIILNWGGTAGYMEAQDVRIDEAAPSSLIVDGAITASKLTVTSLSAISANMGSLTVDNTLSLGTAGVIKTSGINYGGDGIFLGRESGTNKFSVGTGSAKLTFDGSTLTVPAANLTGTAAANTIATTSISAGAATSVYSGSSTGSSITISISVPSSAAGLSVLAYSGNPYTQSDGKGGVYTVIPDANIIVNGTTQVSQNGTAVWNTATPTTGTYNVVTTRAAGLTGTMWCQIIVAKR